MTITGTLISGNSYATVAQFRQIMTQVPTTAATTALIQMALDAATAMIDGELGFAFAAYGATATSKDVLLRRASAYLDLPQYQAASIASVYEVYAKGSTSEYLEEVLATAYDILDDGRLYNYLGWAAGWYRVTAKWGQGAAPAAIVQVCLEKAINLWLGGQGGQYSDVVGIEGGGAVGYNRAWTNAQRAELDNARLQGGGYGFA